MIDKVERFRGLDSLSEEENKLNSSQGGTSFSSIVESFDVNSLNNDVVAVDDGGGVKVELALDLVRGLATGEIDPTELSFKRDVAFLVDDENLDLFDNSNAGIENVADAFINFLYQADVDTPVS